MKRILSILMAALLLVSTIPTAFAAEGEHDYSNGTQITLVGTQENQGAQWTVTVPAKMQPGQTGTVKAEGMWSADKYLQVSAPTSVALTYGAQSMDVAITFDTIYKIGSSIEAVTASHDIAVADASRLFGTWEGTLAYDVQLIEKGDVNRDGIIDMTDLSLLKNLANGTPTETDLLYADFNADGSINNKDISIIKTILGQNGIEYMDE